MDETKENDFYDWVMEKIIKFDDKFELTDIILLGKKNNRVTRIFSESVDTSEESFRRYIG